MWLSRLYVLVSDWLLTLKMLFNRKGMLFFCLLAKALLEMPVIVIQDQWFFLQIV